MIWALLGCAGNLSNDIFVEDLQFTQVLPDADAVTLTWPSDTPPVDGSLAAEGLAVVTGVDAWTRSVFQVTETIRAVSPSERGEHHRVWGPGHYDAYPGNFLQVEMSRTSDLALYVYTFQVASSSAGPWDAEFFTGQAVDPSDAAARWHGVLEWDADALSAVVDQDAGESFSLSYRVDPDRTEVLAESWETQGDRLWVAQSADGAGELQLATRGDGATSMVLQWDAQGAGRADVRVGGGLTGTGQAVECWGQDGALTYAWSEPEGLVDAVGAASDCALTEPGVLDQL